MPSVTLATADEWAALAQAAGAAPTPLNVGDEAAIVFGPVDVESASMDCLDFAVIPACGGHNFQL